MIATGLLIFVTGFLNLLSALLPSGNYFTNLNSAVSWLYNTMYGLNWLAPIDTIISILGLIVTIELFFFLWNGITWFIRLLRGQ